MLLRFLIPCAVFFLLPACTTLKPAAHHDAGPSDIAVTGIPAPSEHDNIPGWHSVAFTIHWPDQEGPVWHVDAFLAHTLCQDILGAYGKEIILWRFHRRAVRDATGHRFSFKFYGSEALALKINHQVENHPVSKQLLSSGIVTAIDYRPLAGKSLPRIGDTSDPAWSEPLQASWPYFAMGVSQTWLALINEVVQVSPPPCDVEPLNKRLAFYQLVNNQVTEYWHLEGRHAYLHHLNALFGYHEIQMLDGGTMRF